MNGARLLVDKLFTITKNRIYHSKTYNILVEGKIRIYIFENSVIPQGSKRINFTEKFKFSVYIAGLR